MELIKPLDFSSYTFRASSAGKLCGKVKGRTPMEKYEYCKAQILDLEAKCNAAKDKAGKTYMKNRISLAQKKELLPVLERFKDSKYYDLSQTAISYLIDVYTEVRYGVKKEIFGKYLDSGKAREDMSIEMMKSVDDELYRKCTLPRQCNEYVEGECDIRYPLIDPIEITEPEGITIDIKSVWDMFTFQPHTLELKENTDDGEEEIENDLYKWQGVVYCKLYKTIKFILAYCLVNMPDELIEDELRRMLYKIGSKKEDSEEYQNAVTEYMKKCKFDHIPEKTRIIRFEFDYKEEDYLFLIDKIKIAREWLNDYAIKEWERETGGKWTIEAKDEANVIIEAIKEDNANKGDSQSFVALVETVIPSTIEKVAPCPQCGSDKYHSYFNGEFGEFKCPDCKFDTADGEEPDLNWNKTSENDNFAQALPEIVTPLVAPLVVSEHVTITPGVIPQAEVITTAPAIQQTTDVVQPEKVVETDPLMIEIDKCTSREDCVELYTSKGPQFWKDNQKYMVAITDKRNSFKVVPAAPPPVSKKEEKSPAAPPAQAPIEKKPVYQVPKNDPQPGDDAKIIEFRDSCGKFETVTQFKDYYIANRIIIDRNSEFRLEYEKAGQMLAMKIAEEKRKAINKEATGG